MKWSGFVACAWTLLFLAPQVWWALGVPMGFPGGDDAYQVAWSSAWFPRYNLFVVCLGTTGFLVLLALVTPLKRAVPRRALLSLVWLGAALLTARGVVGLVADKFSDLVWWPTFVLGGVLYGMVAWRQRVSQTERM